MAKRAVRIEDRTAIGGLYAIAEALHECAASIRRAGKVSKSLDQGFDNLAKATFIGLTNPDMFEHGPDEPDESEYADADDSDNEPVRAVMSDKPAPRPKPAIRRPLTQ